MNKKELIKYCKEMERDIGEEERGLREKEIEIEAKYEVLEEVTTVFSNIINQN